MSRSAIEIDYLIAGQGLAGTLLARALLSRGCRVVVADVGNQAGASRVAAGLISPVTGRKLVPTWRGDELLPFARQYYRTWETELRTQFYSDKSIWRFFGSEDEAETWEKKRDGELADRTEELPAVAAGHPSLQPGLDGFMMQRGGYVDTRKLLQLFRKQLQEQQALVERAVLPEEIKIEAEGIRWREFRARKVIFCEGHAASQNPFFSWIPFRHAKGEVLTVAIESLPEDVILNRRKWLLPIGNRYFRAGATYDTRDLSENPTAAGEKEILDGIGRIILERPNVLAHEAGIRPVVKDQRLVAGLHPGKPNVGIFNGLGSKGVLWGPYFAEQLAASLETGTSLDSEIDVRRNL